MVAVYDPKSKLMFCDICVSAQVVNSFTSGCSVMKKESVTKHESKKGKTKFLFLNCFLYVIGKLRQYKTLTRPQVPCSHSLSSVHDVYMYVHELNRLLVKILAGS